MLGWREGITQLRELVEALAQASGFSTEAFALSDQLLQALQQVLRIGSPVGRLGRGEKDATQFLTTGLGEVGIK